VEILTSALYDDRGDAALLALGSSSVASRHLLSVLIIMVLSIGVVATRSLGRGESSGSSNGNTSIARWQEPDEAAELAPFLLKEPES
jgi:hypothetical protein